MRLPDIEEKRNCDHRNQALSERNDDLIAALIAEKFSLTLPHARTVILLAGLGEER